MPLSNNSRAPLLPRHLTTEHDAWLRRLASKYATPRAVLCRQLGRPGALEYEIALLIAEAARATAEQLLERNDWPPEGADLWDRAVAGCYRQLRDAKYAAAEAESKRLLDQLLKDAA